MWVFEVVDSGLFSTMQDRGRPGWGHLGVRHAGAADPLALAAANLLVGAPADAPVVEMTLLGARLAVRSDVLVGLAGADMGRTFPRKADPWPRAAVTGSGPGLRWSSGLPATVLGPVSQPAGGSRSVKHWGRPRPTRWQGSAGWRVAC